MTVLDAPEVAAAARLRARPVTPLPDRLAVGRGNALFVDGCCSHPTHSISELRVLIDEVEHPVMAKGQPPPGRLSGSDYWWSIVTFEPVTQPRFTKLRLRARFADGGEATAALGVIELRDQVDAPEPPTRPDARTDSRDGEASEPLIAVCMATYEPPLELFRRQIDSIREQTYRNWVCVISDDRSSPETLGKMHELIGDDSRFHVFPSQQRRGVYRNFERALALAPSEASCVALCDQDDRWYPRKLDTLQARLATGAKLAYSDMRIIRENQAVVSDTYWSYRRNNHTNYGSLLVANTVTGAASLLSREVLDYALPFPPKLGNNYHDHWIALVAMSLGRVAYVDEPLHDYVQHGGAALGHARANAAHRRGRNRRERIRRRVERLRRLPRERFHLGWRYLYFDLWCPIALTARVAELRCGEVMASGKLRTLRRFQDSRRGLSWLAARSARPLLGATETLSRERVLLAALAWRRLVQWRTRTQALRQITRGSAPPPEPRASSRDRGRGRVPERQRRRPGLAHPDPGRLLHSRRKHADDAAPRVVATDRRGGRIPVRTEVLLVPLALVAGDRARRVARGSLGPTRFRIGLAGAADATRGAASLAAARPDRVRSARAVDVRALLRARLVRVLAPSRTLDGCGGPRRPRRRPLLRREAPQYLDDRYGRATAHQGVDAPPRPARYVRLDRRVRPNAGAERWRSTASASCR